MKTWSYSTNPLPQFRSGSVNLIEMPWWLLFIEWLIDHSHTFVPSIPFPNFPRRMWWFQDEDDIHPTTLREYYGSLDSLWCCHVCNPVFNWIYAHPKRVEYTFDLGYDKLREVLYEHGKEHFDSQDALE